MHSRILSAALPAWRTSVRLAKLTPVCLCALLLACGGIVERNPPGITALCVTECLLFTDGHRACVTLTDPKQLEEEWWWDVERVESSEACREASAQ